MKEKGKKIAKFLVKLAVSVVLLGLLIYKINWVEVFGYVQKISVGQIVLYVAVLLIGMIISSYKWMLLARHKGFEFPLKTYFQLYITGSFINNFFPSFIGGDTYRAYQIGKDKKQYVAAGTSVVMDRITGLLGAMILSVLAGLLNWRVIVDHKVLLALFFATIGALAAFVVLLSVRRLAVWGNIAKMLPAKVSEVIKDFNSYRNSTLLWKVLIVSCLYGIVGLALVNYILFLSLGISLSIVQYLSVIFLISIVSSIPVSVNNIGIKEWAYVTFFGFFGVSASAVVTVALVSRILQMLVSFAALPLYIKSRSVQKNAIS